MRFALVGYGRMGKAIEGVCRDRGHELTGIVDPAGGAPGTSSSLDPDRLRGTEVAFEFTAPSAAEDNVVGLLERGVAVVCGTTGWEAGARVVRAVEASSAGAVIAPNFSVGMNLFYSVVRHAAGLLLETGLYDPFVLEAHHRGKIDAPSGTARWLAEILRDTGSDARVVRVGDPSGGVPPGAVHVASVRAGHEPGTHVVGFDGPDDALSLRHRARGRGGFALGAVLAGEWVRGRRGLHRFERILEELFQKGGRS